MKKIGIILICFLIIGTGCSNKEEKKISDSTVKTTEKETNLITEEQETSPVSTEEELLSFLKDSTQKAEQLAETDLTKSKENTLKSTFVTLTDFIFYGGSIKGKTFTSLTDSTKTQVIDLWTSLDQKIDKAVPNYKETIQSTSGKVYTNIKEKAFELKNTIISKYKEQVGEEEYNNVIQVIEKDTNKLKEAYEPVIDTVKEKSKNTYNKTKDKVSSWYESWKESSD